MPSHWLTLKRSVESHFPPSEHSQHASEQPFSGRLLASRALPVSESTERSGFSSPLHLDIEHSIPVPPQRRCRRWLPRWVLGQTPDEDHLSVRITMKKAGAISLFDAARAGREGVDNTGLAGRTWLAEEALVLHCLRDETTRKLISGSSLIELGAGGSALVSLAVTHTLEPARVVATDGNEQALKLLRHNTSSTPQIECALLKWSEGCSLRNPREQFNVLVAADVAFFEHFHPHLAAEIYQRLRPGGTAILMNPNRRGSLGRLLEHVSAQPQLSLRTHCQTLSASSLLADNDADWNVPICTIIDKE